MSFALYRKYRPQSFEDLVGQSAVQITLLEALKQGKLVHAYLFSGPRGTGKTSTARLIAKAIQCEQRGESGEACGSCEICSLNQRNELIDLIEIDAASNRGIDEIRDLREKIRFAPTRAKAKVYIIDEVHMLTKEAFNALLKSLEEPPEFVYFILATTEIHKIPETILSRCQRYDFKRVSVDHIVDRLKHIAKKENFEVNTGALELLAKHADGGMRDAISLLEQFSSEAITEELVRERLGLSNHQSCDQLYGALGSSDTQKGLAVIESLHNEGYNLQQFTTAFLGHLRHKLHEAIAADKKTVVPKLLDWIHLFDEAWVKLKRASIAQLPLEIAVIRATHQSAAAPAQQESMPIIESKPSKRQEGLKHLDTIKAQIPSLLSTIKNPALRQSFKSGNLKEMQGNTLHFVFASKFHYDKVHAADGLVEIEAALKNGLKRDIKLVVELDEGTLASEVTSVDTLGWDTVEEPL
jgi:DNA polymerase-3 subunit gamma/tau